MSLLVDPSAPEAPAGPEQGVIDDARRRQRLRRQRVTALLVLAGIGGLAAIILANRGSGSLPRSKVGGAHTFAARARRTHPPRGATLTPNLVGGAYGWCLTIAGGGSCPIVPTDGGELVGDVVGTEPRTHAEVITVLLTPAAVAVLVNGKRLPAVTLAALPYHLRVARITIPRPSTPATPTSNEPPQPPAPPTPQSLLAIDAQGHVLRAHSATGEARAVRITWWKRPTALPNGPCQIRAHGIPGLTPEWGHVASSITPYPERIVGRAFYSCIDTEYYLHNWPLDAAILLDAQHPGTAPAAIPGLTRLRGAPTFYNGPGDGFHGPETAIRKGNAWLIVAGGSGLDQRIDVLEHLSASVKL